MEIAWLGTGIMGAPMARNLMRAGHRLRLHNRTAKRAVALAADRSEATVATDAAAAAAGAEAVFIMVPDTPDVESVLARIEPALHEGQLVIDTSTIAPAAERAIAARLEKLGRRVTHIGPAGAGQMTKLANQIAVALTLEATAEALALAESGGLDRTRVLEAIGAGAAGSWQLANLGPKIIARDWRPGFFIKLIRKDLRLVGEPARDGHLALPGLAMMQSMFN